MIANREERDIYIFSDTSGRPRTMKPRLIIGADLNVNGSSVPLFIGPVIRPELREFFSGGVDRSI